MDEILRVQSKTNLFVTDRALSLILAAADSLKEADPDAMIPIPGMSPHYLSFSKKLESANLLLLFTLTTAGDLQMFVYLKMA